MRKGHRPQPTALRILRGNPSKTPLNEHEPQHPPLIPEVEAPPPEFNGDAIMIAEYNRLAPRLAITGHVTQGDRGTLIAYCVAWGRWVEASRLCDTEPITFEGHTGTVYMNPMHTAANRAMELFLRAAAELGLTPSSRTRVVARAPGASGSKWAGALK